MGRTVTERHSWPLKKFMKMTRVVQITSSCIISPTPNYVNNGNEMSGIEFVGL